MHPNTPEHVLFCPLCKQQAYDAACEGAQQDQERVIETPINRQ